MMFNYSNSVGVYCKLPHSSFFSGSTSVYSSSKIATSIRRYWKYFPPAHSSGNNVLNVPNLSLLRMYSLTHVLCFRFFLAYDTAVAAPWLTWLSALAMLLLGHATAAWLWIVSRRLCLGQDESCRVQSGPCQHSRSWLHRAIFSFQIRWPPLQLVAFWFPTSCQLVSNPIAVDN